MQEQITRDWEKKQETEKKRKPQPACGSFVSILQLEGWRGGQD